MTGDVGNQVSHCWMGHIRSARGGGSLCGNGIQLETPIWAHVYLNIHADSYIQRIYRYVYIHGLVYTHIYFLALSAEKAQKNNTSVAMSLSITQTLVSIVILQ